MECGLCARPSRSSCMGRGTAARAARNGIPVPVCILRKKPFIPQSITDCGPQPSQAIVLVRPHPEYLAMRFHHVGIVVSNIEEQVKAFQASLGAEWDGRIFHDPNQKVRVAFV